MIIAKVDRFVCAATGKNGFTSDKIHTRQICLSFLNARSNLFGRYSSITASTTDSRYFDSNFNVHPLMLSKYIFALIRYKPLYFKLFLCLT
jgi:hypothetical protein